MVSYARQRIKHSLRNVIHVNVNETKRAAKYNDESSRLVIDILSYNEIQIEASKLMDIHSATLEKDSG